MWKECSQAEMCRTKPTGKRLRLLAAAAWLHWMRNAGLLHREFIDTLKGNLVALILLFLGMKFAFACCMNRRILFLIISFFIADISFAQVKRGETYEFKDVYDSAYGITIYEALNMGTGGDSTRNDAKGYAAQGW